MDNINYENVSKKLAAYIISKDKERDDSYDEDKVDFIIKYYNNSCMWEKDEVCVNDQSKWCADFVDPVKCGACPFFSLSK